MKLFTFKGGVHPFDGKDLSADQPLVRMESAPEMAFLLSQHIGAPAKAVVKKGDRVLRGQMLAQAGGFVSAPVFSSVSGKVTKIEKRRNAVGGMTDAVIVENDGLDETVEFDALPGSEALADTAMSDDAFIAKVDELISRLTPEEIRKRISDAGIVGMGGAGFPTHVKLTPKNPDEIEYILVNAAECEPYITCDDRLLQENTRELRAGLRIVLSLFPKAKGYFCIEDNKPTAISILEKEVASDDKILVAPCMTKYPEGAERSLIYAVTGREVNSKMLPADAGCIVDNTATIFAIYEAVIFGKPLYERSFTFTGDAAAKPANYIIPVGMTYADIVEKAGGFKADPEKIISGGPMMGFAQADLSAVATKTSSALTCFTKDVISPLQETPCINCGRCVSACPARLVPSHLADMAARKQYDKFEEHYGLECVNCGSCSWTCPAKRPLAALINTGRMTVLGMKRAAAAKAAAEKKAAEEKAAAQAAKAGGAPAAGAEKKG